MTGASGHQSFATTRWSLVLAAAASSSPKAPDPAQALAELCQAYWRPLYAHARRYPLGPADAEDAVQGFFARLLRLDSLAEVDRARGRFRAFLLGSFNHYLADLRDRERAEKRGAHLLAPLDTAAAEAAFANAPAADLPPDRAFDRAWALTLLGNASDRLRSEYQATDRGTLFDALSPSLAGRRVDVAHADLAARLGLSEPAVRVALHRLRQRYRQLLRAEIAATVDTAEDVDDELRVLLAAIAG